MTSALSRDLIFLILQFLDEEKFKETVHRLEQESGLYFNFKYFEDLVLNGSLDDVEKYLSGFTRLDDNRYSMKIFFEIRKQKYLEALDKHDRAKAVDILVKDLKVFQAFNEDLFREITHLLTLDNFRENDQLSTYRDTKTARTVMLLEIKKLLEANPLLREKLQFPNIKGARLRMLINQSLNWQHSLCGNPRQNPDIRTLLVDHNCRNPSDAYAQAAQAAQIASTNQLGFVVSQPFQHAPVTFHTPLTMWMANPSPPLPHPPVVSGVGLSFSTPTPAVVPRSLGDVEMSKPRVSAASDRVMLPGNNSGQNNHGLTLNNVADELPKTVARLLNQGSLPTSMDFHPIQQTLLLVGTGTGDITLWEVSSREKVVSKNFQVWDIGASSMALKASIVKDPSVSVKRILWGPDGALFGVAYSKHLVQLYTYYGGQDIRNHIEIDAHVGSVNDLAFCNPTKQLAVVTCGDDKTIKVWEAATGTKLFTFEGHEAPVISVCPHARETIHFLFSTSVDGKIKAWLYDTVGSRVDYDAPGHSCTTMIYSSDGKRLFSCGTSQDGQSHMVEWHENEGTIKRSYQGFNKRSLGVVQFDTCRNKFLAVGDDYSIKFWEMDNPNLLIVVDAEGGLLASPRIRFNKGGSLLAVSTSDNKIKILATVDGLRVMRSFESHSHVAARLGVVPEALNKNGDSRNFEEAKPRFPEEGNPGKILKVIEISDPARLKALQLTAHVRADKIARLIYANSGTAILALATNAIHLLWRWHRNDQNPSGKATTKVIPQWMQPASGILMTNDLVNAKPEEAVHCFALSKNDSYIMSTSGGKISLFNTMTFKTMTMFMAPPPTVTCVIFHPQDNNVIAVGMDDATIQMYNVRVDEVKSKLKGHTKRVTGLAFSNVLNALVSSGADCQIIVWNAERWERQSHCFLQIPVGRTSSILSDTHVQFHKDQTHFLVVHESQLGIYEATKLECKKQWLAGEFSASISHAVFSCDSQFVYGTFVDGSLRIFAASSLQVQCLIKPSAYIPSDVSSAVYPLVVAAHPQMPNQFAVGMTDGGVIVFEPLESDGKWAAAQPAENEPATTSAPPGPPVIILDQQQSLE